MDNQTCHILYTKLGHAIQSGVAYDQQSGSDDGSPKHLRTGLNLVASDHASLANLLISKGVISQEEYNLAIIMGLEREKAAYEQRLQKRYGVNITLA